MSCSHCHRPKYDTYAWAHPDHAQASTQAAVSPSLATSLHREPPRQDPHSLSRAEIELTIDTIDSRLAECSLTLLGKSPVELWRVAIRKNPRVKAEQIRDMSRLTIDRLASTPAGRAKTKRHCPDSAQLLVHRFTVALLAGITGIDATLLSAACPDLGLTGSANTPFAPLWAPTNTALQLTSALHDVTDFLTHAGIDGLNAAVWGFDSSTLSAAASVGCAMVLTEDQQQAAAFTAMLEQAEALEAANKLLCLDDFRDLVSCYRACLKHRSVPPSRCAILSLFPRPAPHRLVAERSVILADALQIAERSGIQVGYQAYLNRRFSPFPATIDQALRSTITHFPEIQMMVQNGLLEFCYVDGTPGVYVDTFINHQSLLAEIESLLTPQSAGRLIAQLRVARKAKTLFSRLALVGIMSHECQHFLRYFHDYHSAGPIGLFWGLARDWIDLDAFERRADLDVLLMPDNARPPGDSLPLWATFLAGLMAYRETIMTNLPAGRLLQTKLNQYYSRDELLALARVIDFLHAADPAAKAMATEMRQNPPRRGETATRVSAILGSSGYRQWSSRSASNPTYRWLAGESALVSTTVATIIDWFQTPEAARDPANDPSSQLLQRF